MSNTKTSPRYDFYQTPTVVHLSVFVKALKNEDVDVSFGDHSLDMTLRPAGAADPQTLSLQLYDEIDRENSSYSVFSSKVDVALQKKTPGRQWASVTSSEAPQPPSYQRAQGQAEVSQTTTATTPTPPVNPAPRPRSKWDSLKLEDDDESGGPAGGQGGSSESGGQGIDAFFQKLYADADDDTRRAMMKSYTESGGTSLSTNWADVQKGEVQARPPDGMEAKKWT